jgi:hypothetical protein
VTIGRRKKGKRYWKEYNYSPSAEVAKLIADQWFRKKKGGKYEIADVPLQGRPLPRSHEIPMLYNPVPHRETWEAYGLESEPVEDDYYDELERIEEEIKPKKKKLKPLPKKSEPVEEISKKRPRKFDL